MASLPFRRLQRTRGPVPSSLAIRNVVVGGHRTSVRLEPLMWEALREITRRRDVTLNGLITEIDQTRDASSLTAAIRVYIVEFYRNAVAAGEGPRLRANG